MSDDIYKLVITFNDELNPGHLPAGAESSSGIINAVFDPYDAAEQITAISAMVMNDINFNYTDCTVTLIYNRNTKQVQSLDMMMNIDITADTFLMEINARIVDITEFENFAKKVAIKVPQQPNSYRNRFGRSYSSIPSDGYSKEDIRQILESGDPGSIRELSRYFSRFCGTYARPLQYYATLLNYGYVIVPHYDVDSKPKKIKTAYKKIS
jgi:hypothetical protein